MTSHEFQQIAWDEVVEDDCRQLVRLAAREDLDRTYDWTTMALIDHQTQGRGAIVARQAGVIAGLPAAQTVLSEMAPSVAWRRETTDGSDVTAGMCVAVVTGPARNILTCERILLNFLGRLSGIATLTRRYVEAVRGTQARIYDTRKTTPGWRRLEKYAVHCGGGCNHRTGLFDALLIKDNHLALVEKMLGDAQGAPAKAVELAREFLEAALSEDQPQPPMMIEVEVDSLEQLTAVLEAQPDIVLLDNFSPDGLREAVAQRDRLAPEVELEASGGVTLESVTAIAQTGVDRISVGALTHSAPVLDLGLDWLE